MDKVCGTATDVSEYSWLCILDKRGAEYAEDGGVWWVKNWRGGRKRFIYFSGREKGRV
jgi:hypothetical protein